MGIKTWCWVLLLAGLTQAAKATYEDSDWAGVDALAAMDLEQLLSVEVTMTSRNEARAFSAPAAIYVINQEDIRRSGLTTIPDLLRLVPGLHVAKLDGNKWAINARGENDRFSSTMLVLIDGRSVYTPLFAGVYWDVQETLLADIERIEVVRGPGASLWGANAVTGIINIITKDAADTQGWLVSAGVGEGDTKNLKSVRYGFQRGELSGRVYVKNRQSDEGEFLNAKQSENAGFFKPKSSAEDDGHLTQGGFRLDWQANARHVTVQGDVYHGLEHDFLIRDNAPLRNNIDVEGANVLLRWQQSWGTSNMTIQYYADYTRRVDQVFSEVRETHDVDFQHTFLWPRQQFTWGAAYRTTADDTELQFRFELDPENRSNDLYSVFFQDRIELLEETVFLTIGSKFEYNDFTHDEYQPSYRLRWSPSERQTFWMAYSRALRTPSRGDSDARLNFDDVAFLCAFGVPGFVLADDGACIIPIGNETKLASPKLKVFQVISKEIGYRLALDTVVLDVAAFYNNFDQEQANANGVNKFYGVESDVRWQVSEHWRLAMAYTYHHGRTLETGGQRQNVDGFPENSVNLRSYWDINAQWALDTLVYYADHASDGGKDIPSYVRLDLRLGWQPSPAFETSLAVTNILDSVHPEGTENQRLTTGARRGAFLQTRYRF